jgi:catechol 2,3-dioxygenase-like lactoylglutathione lyase family enzyme
MAPRQFRDIHPILPTRDLSAALAHYASLGFRVHGYADGDDYGFVRRGGVELHLTFQPHSYYPAGAIAVAYLHVADADAIYAAWSQPGIGGRTDPPEDMPWGMHEGVHVDPDGNVLRYGTPIDEASGRAARG